MLERPVDDKSVRTGLVFVVMRLHHELINTVVIKLVYLDDSLGSQPMGRDFFFDLQFDFLRWWFLDRSDFILVLVLVIVLRDPDKKLSLTILVIILVVIVDILVRALLFRDDLSICVTLFD